MIYIKEGFGRADDKASEIWFKPMIEANDQPLMLRDYFGKTKLGKEDISRLIEDYYDERGWQNKVLMVEREFEKRDRA
ncbi:MAG: hypothetical protein JRJ85_27635 [Deltaproteobacteria bacterium]|nr:hypothetical protein [Deltaproteobacteria bacterium]